ncbi:MAG: hypothetical protein DHS20C10_09460 [marine bacterium B5-7]|nr:MAG: hypothetical protein DHS20C10_09460 [marine bacterium B5-7]
MNDFFSFRRMITPWLIQVLFWIAIAGCILSAVTDMVHAHFLKGLGLLFFGIAGIRISCELLMLFFRMNETLTDIRDTLANKP